ncbi:MAG: ThiF family adenylyltransferase, partial [Candidatus Eremiobacterota bacterium]
YNIDFYKILKEAWNLNSYGNISFILIGFPIPKIYGDENFEIHWQPLIFNNLTYYRKNNNLYNIKSRQQDKIWKKLNKEYCFKPNNQLPWGKSINLTHERLYSRGNLSDSLQNKNISLFGCGALGSIIAELLVRGGINNFSLFDYDIIQFGNLCRHTLDGRNLTYNKAESLSEKLVTVNPLVKINAYPNKIPINLKKWNNIKEIMEKLDIIIDCTTSDEAFEWLNNYAITKNKKMISIFFSFHAELLTLIISGSNISCSFIYNDLRNCIKKENPTFAKKYFYQPTKEEQIIEGAGCCFPSFPALNSHIYMLASTTVSIINSYINYKEGLALIIQRNSFNTKIYPNSLIETIWMKKY